ISLAAGFVDQQSLPAGIVEDAWREITADPRAAREALQYGTTQGDPVLRLALARRLLAESGHASPSHEPAAIAEQTIITSGSQQLLYLLAEALINPGDIVIAEAPTYFVFLDLLAARGAEIIGIPIDSGGMCLDSLEKCLYRLKAEGSLNRVKLIYTVSEHSNPSGLSLAEDRRSKLVSLARLFSQQQKIYVLDDAAYRGLTFTGPESPSVWSHDTQADTVIHARTFSKTFSPGIKLGYGVLPPELLKPVLALKGHHDFGTSNLMQRLILQVIESGQYETQVHKLQKLYEAKAQALVDSLESHLGSLKPAVSWTVPKGGLYVWLSLPQTISTSRHGEFFAACLDAGVFYVPGEFCYPSHVEGGQRNQNQMRLCYGVPSEAKITRDSDGETTTHTSAQTLHAWPSPQHKGTACGCQV
ncbi:MAG: aminotransferase class I/II-fold pyridoxal phosphate-dependent enzyme, partial [bacterium]